VVQSSITDFSQSPNPEYKTNVTMPSLPEGNHNLTVKANGLVLIGSPEMEKFYISSSSTTFFAISTQSTEQQKQTNHLLNPVFLIAIVGGALIVAVTLISLVYFKKHKPILN
jgi:hypothetical protein